MSYDSRKSLINQEVVKKVEIFFKGCKYADTLAAHSGDDDGTCYGFTSSCSTGDNYDENIFRSLVFCDSPLASGNIYFSGLKSANFTRPILDPGISMGQRGYFTCEIEDGPHNDVNIVPYENRRSSLGTLWGKMIARSPYFHGLKIQYSFGLRDAGTLDDPEWETHTFFIDQAALSNDIMTIDALDALSLADDKKSVMPKHSNGRLSSAITSGTTTFSFTDGIDFEYGALNDEPWVAVDREAIKVRVTGATSFLILDRGEGGSTEKDHKAGSTVQICLHTGGHLVTLIETALTDYSEVPSSHIDDYSTLISETAELNIDGVLLIKPTRTTTVINNAIKLGGLEFYSNTETEKIIINKDDETNIQPIILDERYHFFLESVKVTRSESSQITQRTSSCGPEDETVKSDENYLLKYTPIAGDIITPKHKGGVNIGKKFDDILLSYSTADALVLNAAASRDLNKFKLVPKWIDAKIDAEHVGIMSQGNLTLGSIVSASTRDDQNLDGSPAASLYKILSIQGNPFDGFNIRSALYQSTIINGVDYTISASKEDYDLSVDFAPVARAEPYIVYIDYGVVIGCLAGAQAFTTGTQTAGVSFHFIVRGAILGRGGIGGNGGVGNGTESLFLGADATNGTHAVVMTVPCTWDVGEGQIYGGGGANGGGNTASTTYPQSVSATYEGDGGRSGQSYTNIASGVAGVNTDTGNFQYYPIQILHYSVSQGVGNRNIGVPWGQDGVNGYKITDPYMNVGSLDAGSKGIAGNAIKTNGHTVSIVSGDNTFNIKGRVDD